MKLVLAIAAIVALAACVEGGKPPCICGFIWDPVCGRNGVTYGSQCDARCDAQNGAMPTSPGECGGSGVPCICNTINDPVCDAAGNQVAFSPCDADCAGISEYFPC